jgi:hypothetical protein
VLARLWKDRRVRWGLGLSALTAATIGVMRLGARPLVNTQTFPNAPNSPQPNAPQAPRRWVEIPRGDHVGLRRGVRYRGCVDLPWYAPTGLVRDRLRPGLEAKGFTDIVIVEEEPHGWPSAECTFWVECTWSKPDAMLERPSAVTHAWAFQ